MGTNHHGCELVVDLVGNLSLQVHYIPSWLVLLHMLVEKDVGVDEDLGEGANHHGRELVVEKNVGVGVDEDLGEGANHHGCELVVDLDGILSLQVHYIPSWLDLLRMMVEKGVGLGVDEG